MRLECLAAQSQMPSAASFAGPAHIVSDPPASLFSVALMQFLIFYSCLQLVHSAGDHLGIAPRISACQYRN